MRAIQTKQGIRTIPNGDDTMSKPKESGEDKELMLECYRDKVKEIDKQVVELQGKRDKLNALIDEVTNDDK